jgi:acetylornithine deacetylase ArgE
MDDGGDRLAHGEPGQRDLERQVRSRIDPEAVLATLRDLVAIDSVNPAYGGPGESEVVEYVHRFLLSNGIAAITQEVAPGRCNLVARVPGGSRALLFEAHADTASSEGMMYPPFEPWVDHGRLHGRGACDTKGGLAAMLHALRTARDIGPRSTIYLAVVVDEEHGFLGVRRLTQDISAAGAVIAEPTALIPVIASKGTLRWKINVEGRAVHSSQAHRGVNAIMEMAELLRLFESDLEPALAARVDPLLGRPTLNVGTIHGGHQVNMVPDLCTIEVDCRTVPIEREHQTLADVWRLIETLRCRRPSFSVWMDPPFLDEPPFATPADAEIVCLCRRVVSAVRGTDHVGVVPYGSDAGQISRAGIPAVVLGPGSIEQAHAADEFVPTDQVIDACEIYARIMLA